MSDQDDPMSLDETLWHAGVTPVRQDIPGMQASSITVKGWAGPDAILRPFGGWYALATGVGEDSTLDLAASRTRRDGHLHCACRYRLRCSRRRVRRRAAERVRAHQPTALQGPDVHVPAARPRRGRIVSVQPSGFLYPQDLPDAIQRLKRATAGDQRAAIALDVLLLELEARDSENYRELRAMQQRAQAILREPGLPPDLRRAPRFQARQDAAREILGET